MVVLLKMGKCNITLHFECDLNWVDLPAYGRHANYRFCNTCQQNVYRVSSDEEAEDHASLGQCIAFHDTGPAILPLDGMDPSTPRQGAHSVTKPPPPPPPLRTSTPGKQPNTKPPPPPPIRSRQDNPG